MKDDRDREKYKGRIQELLTKLEPIKPFTVITSDIKVDQNDIIEECFAGTISVLESLYGRDSLQLRSLLETKKEFSKSTFSSSYRTSYLAQTIRGILRNAQEELNRGLIRNLQAEIAGEIIGDLVQLAKLTLKDGHVNVAAVLVSAALEDGLKRAAEKQGLVVAGKSMDHIINALKANSFFKGAQGPIVTSFVKLRNAAMHADWEKISDADVTSIIGFLEPFIIERFS